MKDKRIILTGAGGGIGSQLAGMLAHSGARLALVDRNEETLKELQQAHGADRMLAIVADITRPQDRARIVAETLRAFDGIDVLINAAGINPFGVFAEQDDAMIENTLQVNTLAPMLLTRAVLPTMLAANSGQIVNIGSTFGSIAFAWFSAYSASKFALRGFSQSLRRELADSGIAVTYVAPRSVRTAINAPQVYDMARATGINIDEPDVVARRILKAVRRRSKECYIGFPESLFVRINAVVPGLVDRALRKQNREARRFAAASGPAGRS